MSPSPAIADAPDFPAPPADGWQPLPPRARRLMLVARGLWALPITLLALVGVGLVVHHPTLKAVVALAVLVLVPTLSLWSAARRFRYTRWMLDDDGFALRRGRLWQTETRVPGNRVQHIDLVRGPIARRFDLATLVIHTAGTRHSAVSLAGLELADAEHLRDALAARSRQHEDD